MKYTEEQAQKQIEKCVTKLINDAKCDTQEELGMMLHKILAVASEALYATQGQKETKMVLAKLFAHHDERSDAYTSHSVN